MNYAAFPPPGPAIRTSCASRFSSAARRMATPVAVVVMAVLATACSPSAPSAPTDVASEVDLGTDPAGNSGAESGDGGEDFKPIGAEENNDWVRKMVDCLNGAGFSAEAFEGSQGILGFQNTGGTQEQVSAWSKGITRCEAKVGKAPEIPRFTADQLAHLYDFYVSQRDCLTSEGLTISGPPSRETFVETYYSSDPWGPYADVDRVSPTTLSELEDKCPQQPSAQDLQ